MLFGSYTFLLYFACVLGLLKLLERLPRLQQLFLLAASFYFYAYWDVRFLFLLCASSAFAIQIFCDFSGYTDIARGVSRCFGIELIENFRAPYLAENITDFWRRWHISLSSWFRDYLTRSPPLAPLPWATLPSI